MNSESILVNHIGSSENLPGYAAFIFCNFVKGTLGRFETATHPSQPFTVYITTTSRGECIKPFNFLAEECVQVSVGVYIEILKFFRDFWPTLEQRINVRVKSMQSESDPIHLDQGLYFVRHGKVVYEQRFDDAFILITKFSMDPLGKFEITLERDGKKTSLDLANMKRASTSLATIQQQITEATGINCL